MSQRTSWKTGFLILFLLYSSESYSVDTTGNVITDEYANKASPTLSKFVIQVWDTHPKVQASVAVVDAARSRMDAASQPLYNPELELDAESAETDTTFIGLSQTIDWADKRSVLSRVGGFELAVADAELASIRQKIAAQVGDALSRYYTVNELHRLSNSRVSLMERFFNIAENRYKAGDIGQVDLDLAKLALSASLMQLASTKANLIRTRQLLIETSGLIQEDWPALPADLPKLHENIPDPYMLIDKLPDLLALRARTEAGKMRISLAERFRRPDPTVSLRGGREESDALVGLNLSIPLFVRNTFRAEVDVASNEAIQQEKLLLDAFLRARTRYSGAEEGYRLVVNALEQWLSGGQVTLADRVKLLQRLWETGELSASDYLIQVRESLDAEVSGIELRGQAWQAWFEWLDASGEVKTWLGL